MIFQRGSGSLIAVILLLMMSAVLLNATRRQLEDSLELVARESRSIRQYSLAASALAWGATLHWAAEREGWFCQRENKYGWRACLTRLKDGDMLMRGDSGPDTVAHFQWMTLNKTEKIMAVPHGWIDYCPLVESEMCLPDG